MSQDFQLLEARTADVRVDMPWRRDRPYINPHATFLKNANTGSSQLEHITAIIGKNGTGKSHLLSAIVQTFIELENAQSQERYRPRPIPLDYLSYRNGGRECVVQQDARKRITLTVDGSPVSHFDLPLPKRIVALTISPFDKFPVPRTIPRSVIAAEESMYQYLGLRDRFGRASIQTLLYRSLNSLFDTGENEALRRSNIGAAFDFLGLKPTINVIYRLRTTSRIRRALNDKTELTQPGVLSPSQASRVLDVVKSGVSLSELHDLLDIATSRADVPPPNWAI